MNAHALLSAQGWRGTGHSLHKTDDSIGLAKPLLLNRKDNTKGLGQKQHFTSDQWWMNAFDEQLKGLDTSKEGTVVQTITTGKLGGLEKNAGKYSVYATFVRGGFLEGTINKLLDKDSASTESESEDDTDQEIVKTMVAPPQEEEDDEEEEKKESKEDRRVRKEAKRKRKEERAREKAARQERKKSKSKKSSTESSDADEEKKRRRARKEQKRKQRLKEGDK
ncbi:Fc.00g016820.m01.CDS01 [Cosmosporella sp. VM-42]